MRSGNSAPGLYRLSATIFPLTGSTTIVRNGISLDRSACNQEHRSLGKTGKAKALDKFFDKGGIGEHRVLADC